MIILGIYAIVGIITGIIIGSINGILAGILSGIFWLPALLVSVYEMHLRK
jgi:hypothetical protein